MTTTPADVGNDWAGRPHVVVIVAHRATRDFIVELLSRDEGCWSVTAVDTVSELDNIGSSSPGLVIVDTADFAACCRELPETFARARVVVIGPEPDPAYRHAALHGGAAAWLSREHIAEELCDALRLTHAATTPRWAYGSPRATGTTSAPAPQPESAEAADARTASSGDEVDDRDVGSARNHVPVALRFAAGGFPARRSADTPMFRSTTTSHPQTNKLNQGVHP